MFEFILAITARSYYFSRRFMPTNIVTDAIDTRRGLKWGVPAMLFPIPYGFAAAYFAGLVEAGGSNWLNVFVLLYVWDALKFFVVGPVSLIHLVAVQVREAGARRRLTQALLSET
ncbi:sulfate permease [Cryobacterium sp. Hz9]|uniref:sulfate permease n=1 Tax=Cryobacterium sp. Hz9 TaxID=1259167 RepID=UPI00106B08F7|nr:sulfate permease [Cryobacterium sp. Hz9]TFB71502.1 sulfate permease [Cryobacterium sp. Hz9]